MTLAAYLHRAHIQVMCYGAPVFQELPFMSSALVLWKHYSVRWMTSTTSHEGAQLTRAGGIWNGVCCLRAFLFPSNFPRLYRFLNLILIAVTSARFSNKHKSQNSGRLISPARIGYRQQHHKTEFLNRFIIERSEPIL